MKLKVFTSLVVAVAILFVGAVTTKTSHQSYRNAGVKMDANGISFYRFSMTFSSTQDTLICDLPPVQPRDVTGQDTTLFDVNLYTSDTAYIAVRYQVSSDNLNWKTYTIGTDSTTWLATGTASATGGRTLNHFVISTPQYAGPQPYHRLFIYGPNASGRVLGYTPKVRADVIPRKQ